MRSLAFAPDGTLLASGSADRLVCLWNLTDGKLSLRARLDGHTEMVNAVVFDATGKLLASAANDGKVLWWDVAAGKKIRQWRLPSSRRRPGHDARWPLPGHRQWRRHHLYLSAGVFPKSLTLQFTTMAARWKPAYSRSPVGRICTVIVPVKVMVAS